MFELVCYVLDFENAANPFGERRTTISGWRQVEETNGPTNWLMQD